MQFVCLTQRWKTYTNKIIYKVQQLVEDLSHFQSGSYIITNADSAAIPWATTFSDMAGIIWIPPGTAPPK